MKSIGIDYSWLMRDEVVNLNLHMLHPYILNLDTTSGTHWTLFMKLSSKILCYFDPFGRPPPNELVDLADHNKLEILYTTNQIQDISSVACGYFVIIATMWLLKYKNIKRFVNKLKTTFTTDLRHNDNIAYDILSSAI